MSVPRGESTTQGAVLPAESSGDPNAVEITTMDAIMARLNLPTIDLLKIDVEGAEVNALRGAALTLDRVRRLVIEYHSPELLTQIRQIVAGAGFSEILLTGNLCITHKSSR